MSKKWIILYCTGLLIINMIAAGFHFYNADKISPAIEEYEELSKDFTFTSNTDPEQFNHQSTVMVNFLDKYSYLNKSDEITLFSIRMVLSQNVDEDGVSNAVLLENRKMIHENILNGRLFGLWRPFTDRTFLLFDIMLAAFFVIMIIIKLKK